MKMKSFEAISKEFVKLASEKLRERLVYLALYGSVARKEAVEYSDIDIFAVVKDKKAKERIYEIAFEIEFKHGVLLSVIVRTANELKTMKNIKSLYLKEVLNTGKVLYGKQII